MSTQQEKFLPQQEKFSSCDFLCRIMKKLTMREEVYLISNRLRDCMPEGKLVDRLTYFVNFLDQAYRFLNMILG